MLSNKKIIALTNNSIHFMIEKEILYTYIVY